MLVDRLFPVSPVSFIALSQSYTLHVPLAHILPPCLWSPSLPFPRYRFRHHSPHYVIFFHPHDVPIPFQSSLRYLSGRLHYFRRSSDVFVPDFVFSCHSTHPPQHPHLVHLNPWFLSFGRGPGFSSIACSRSNNCSINLPLQLHRHPLVTQHSTAFLPVHPPCSHSLRYLSLHPSFLFYARPQVLEVNEPFNFLTKNLYLWSMKYRIIILIIIISLGQIFYRILQTHHACTHARVHTRTREHTCAHTAVVTIRRTVYRYSSAPSRDRQLRWHS